MLRLWFSESIDNKKKSGPDGISLNKFVDAKKGPRFSSLVCGHHWRG